MLVSLYESRDTKEDLSKGKGAGSLRYETCDEHALILKCDDCVLLQISEAVVEVQEAVLQQEPRLVKAMIPAPTLHITLLVTHLASQEQVSL